MWEVLGIAPTNDPRAIRRAYAARLRQMDPDRDRAGFARLRDALESALARAARPPRPASERPPAEPLPVLSEQEPDRADTPIVVRPEELDRGTDLRLPPIVPRRDEPRSMPPAVDTTSDRALLVGLESALQRRDAHEAVRLYIRASATGAVPLGNTERMLRRLFDAALGDARFNPDEFRALARTFGWDRPLLDSPVVSDVRDRVSARLAAEDWYDNLAAIAAHRQRLGRKWVRAARLVLRRIRGWALFRIHRPTLQTIVDEYARHATWLHDRIDPAWVVTLKRRMRRRELFAGVLLTLVLGGVLLDAAIVLATGAVGLVLRGENSVAFLITIPIGLVLFGFVRLLQRHVVDVWRRRP
jgi:hypothetical protein